MSLRLEEFNHNIFGAPDEGDNVPRAPDVSRLEEFTTTLDPLPGRRLNVIHY